jgi:aspartate kinase
VAHDLGVARVTITVAATPQLAPEIFARLAEHYVPVDMVSASCSAPGGGELGFTARCGDLDPILDGLRRTAAHRRATVRVEPDLGKVSLVGTALLDRPHHTAHMLAALAGAGIATTSMASSQLRTCVTVPLADTWDAVRTLHREFTLGRPGIAEPPA